MGPGESRCLSNKVICNLRAHQDLLELIYCLVRHTFPIDLCYFITFMQRSWREQNKSYQYVWVKQEKVNNAVCRGKKTNKQEKNSFIWYNSIFPMHFINSTQRPDICLTSFVSWRRLDDKTVWINVEWLPCLWIIPPCSILATEQRCLSLSFRVTP